MAVFKKIGCALVLLVITFPVIRPGVSLQIDPQIHWVFNYLFHQDFSKTQHLIFPHGPLTFINFPLSIGHNLFLGTLIHATLRLGFISTFLKLGNVINPKKWWLHLILAFCVLEFMELDFVITGLVANSLFLYLYTQKNRWFIFAILIATLGFYTKIAIGVIAFSMIVPLLFYLFFEKKSPRRLQKLFLRVTSIPIALALSWFLLYQNFTEFGKYTTGMIELVKGNSDSAGLYPDNNWWWLGVSIFSFLVLPLVQKEKTTWLVYILLGFSVFAVWKHGMARQDPWHMIKIFGWLLLFYSYIFLLNKQIKPLAIISCITTLLFFHANIKSSVGLFVHEFGWDGYQNFAAVFFNQKDFFKENSKASEARIQIAKLSPEDLQLIDNQTVDCYPWNYAFVAANDLNWQPRPIIQSYAAYTPWLDQQNASHFSSTQAPQFLIWENDILKRDIWEGELTSIDNRYLLNDEPQTILSIFSNYKIVSKNDVYLLLKKVDSSPLLAPRVEKITDATWHQWIDVPYFGDGILRAKFHFESTFLKRLKAKAYKDEPLFIEYLFADGTKRKYRFTAENATQGLWINPFISKPSDDFIHAAATKIRFSCANDFLVKDKIQLAWAFIPLAKSKARNSYNNSFALFKKDKRKKRNVLFEKNDAFDDSVVVAANSFSPAYEIPIVTLQKDSSTTFEVRASVAANLPHRANGKLVITLEEAGEVLLWEGKPIEDFMTIFNQWETVAFGRSLPKKISDKAVLKIYVWNSGKEDFKIRAFRMWVVANQ